MEQLTLMFTPNINPKELAINRCTVPHLELHPLDQESERYSIQQKKSLNSMYDVHNSVLSYISGLCTAAVEQQELHKLG